MKEALDATFLQQVNQNMGIAHKVCRVYFIEPSEQEDLLQEMMYQLWKSYPAFGGRSKFSTWMYSVCLNTAITFLKKSKQNQNQSLTLKHLEIADQKTGQLEENIKLLFEAIATLSALNKAIILLSLDDVSYDDIATITGLTKSNVSVRLVRIKKELEGKLKHTINTQDNGNF